MKKYLLRLEHMHDLIKKKRTGCPNQFSRKLGLSRSMLMNYLAEMKELGAPIEYDFFAETYFYKEETEFYPYFKSPDKDG